MYNTHRIPYQLGTYLSVFIRTIPLSSNRSSSFFLHLKIKDIIHVPYTMSYMYWYVISWVETVDPWYSHQRLCPETRRAEGLYKSRVTIPGMYSLHPWYNLFIPFLVNFYATPSFKWEETIMFYITNKCNKMSSK